jgi:two-component system invasion response regulator UvrY
VRHPLFSTPYAVRERARRAPRVLLVDDNQPLLTALARLLPAWDIQVAGLVERGELVLDALQDAMAHGPVDVVVMDVRMPGMGGLEATRLVGRAFPDLPVVLHTACAGSLAQQGREAGAVAEVTKGDDPANLVHAILDAHHGEAVQAAGAEAARC